MPDSTPSDIPHSGSAIEGKIASKPIAASFRPFAWRNAHMPSADWMALIAIKAYQVLVPNSLKRRCIYEPTCSHYAMIVIERYGFNKGFAMAKARFERCDSSRFTPGQDLP